MTRTGGEIAADSQSLSLRFDSSGDRYLTVGVRRDVTLASTLAVLALDEKIRRSRIAGVLETVATWTTILVHFDPLTTHPQTVADAIRTIASESSGGPVRFRSRIIDIPIRYGGRWGPDLNFVAEANDISTKEVIARHSQSLHLVGMISCTPGQANCMFLNQSKIVTAPKYAEPRTYTPEGVVGLGGSSTSIYSVATAGGFQMIGYAPLPIYDPWRRLPQFDGPVLLKVADQIRFVPIDDDQMAEIVQLIREARYETKIQASELEASS